FPEQIKKISIHRGGGGLANFVVLANSKLTGFTAVSYFFTLTRDEPKIKALASASGGNGRLGGGSAQTRCEYVRVRSAPPSMAPHGFGRTPPHPALC
ncbi:hypothetical protein, partial [Marinobacter salarius]